MDGLGVFDGGAGEVRGVEEAAGGGGGVEGVGEEVGCCVFGYVVCWDEGGLGWVLELELELKRLYRTDRQSTDESKIAQETKSVNRKEVFHLHHEGMPRIGL